MAASDRFAGALRGILLSLSNNNSALEKVILTADELETHFSEDNKGETMEREDRVIKTFGLRDTKPQGLVMKINIMI